MRRIGSLFSGIGGLELGLERAGLGRVVWHVERDAWCRGVLAKHWPDAERFDDVCAVGSRNLAPVDVICGGFPCQDLSYAGKGAGLVGERSGLWREYARIVRELRPSIVVVENVSALLARGLGDVLGDLAACGYDAVWDCVPAAAVGAPHRRDRLFVVAHARRGCVQPERAARALSGAKGTQSGEAAKRERHGDAIGDGSEAMAHADMRRRESVAQLHGEAISGAADWHSCGEYTDGRRDAVGHAEGQRRRWERSEPIGKGNVRGAGCGADRRDDVSASQPSVGRATHGFPAGLDRVRRAGYRWPSGPQEPQAEWEAPRVAQSVSSRGKRLKALGNAVVPQVGEVIGYVARELVEAMEACA